MKALLVEYLPWVLSLFTAVHTFLVGNKDIRGWLVAMTAQVMWSIWVVASATWGLLPLNIILWGLYIRNYRRWRNHEDDASKLKAALARISDLEIAHDIRSKTINSLKDQVYQLRARLHADQAAKKDDRQAIRNPYRMETVPVPPAPEPLIVFPSYPDWERRHREPPPAFEAGGAINAFAGGGADGTWSAAQPPIPSLNELIRPGVIIGGEDPGHVLPEPPQGSQWSNADKGAYGEEYIQPPAPSPAVDSADTCSRSDYSDSSSSSDSNSSGGSSGTD